MHRVKLCSPICKVLMLKIDLIEGGRRFDNHALKCDEIFFKYLLFLNF